MSARKASTTNDQQPEVPSIISAAEMRRRTDRAQSKARRAALETARSLLPDVEKHIRARTTAGCCVLMRCQIDALGDFDVLCALESLLTESGYGAFKEAGGSLVVNW